MSTKDPAYVAEQTGQVIGAEMTTAPITPPKERVITDAMGALVTFEGIVRDHDGGQRVDRLVYSAHPTAQQEIERVAQECIEQHPHTRLWCAHRTGDLRVGDLAFVVLAASAHRKDAFAAAEDMANQVKAEVPIWKEQFLSDNTVQWVGLE